MNHQEPGDRKSATPWAQPDPPASSAMVGGRIVMEAAKMTGITPAMFTRIGMYVVPPDVMRRPTCRLAYWIGMRRTPSFTKTMPSTMATAMMPMITAVTGGSPSQPRSAAGRADTIEQKMSSEMPLPTPFCVMSSPIHITSVVPAVSEMTMRKVRDQPTPGRASCERKYRTYASDCRRARPTVM